MDNQGTATQAPEDEVKRMEAEAGLISDETETTNQIGDDAEKLAAVKQKESELAAKVAIDGLKQPSPYSGGSDAASNPAKAPQVQQGPSPNVTDHPFIIAAGHLIDVLDREPKAGELWTAFVDFKNEYHQVIGSGKKYAAAHPVDLRPAKG